MFQEYLPEAFIATLERAVAAFRAPSVWRALQVEGMRQDNSWDHSAQEYVTIYDRVITQGLEARG